ncbi:MAG: DUF971 domain-containing protein [Candidatus Poseidoniales archaeon]|nr:DUF971 domain-containing protein [Candidatus Poseidoniales archaeon]
MSSMDDSEALTDLERGKEDCVLRFADGQAFRVEYLDIRQSCPCAKCGPRQENEQRIIEFREEVMRLRLDKPKAELVGRYGLRFSWPSGCSSGIYSFPLLRKVAEDKGTSLP